MENWLPITLLYLAGIVLLVADIFLPSHAVLSVAALGVLSYALYLTYQISENAAIGAFAGLLVVVPTILYIAVRTWHRTPIGRKISPPNPVLSEEDRLPRAELEALIGTEGRTQTPLRPVGTCLFDGRRVEAVAEHGMIAANVPVEAVRLSDRTLVVRPADAHREGTT
jgi:membrane-bound serine protease (ClpP class)